MTVCLVLTRAPLDRRKLVEALAQHHPVEVLTIEACPLDGPDKLGIAELMREVQAEHGLCIVDTTASVYEDGVFDTPSDIRTSLLGETARRGLAEANRAVIVLMLEWDGFQATQALSGGPADLRAFVAIDGSWPSQRYVGQRSVLQQDSYRTMVFTLLK